MAPTALLMVMTLLPTAASGEISGELRQWHRVTITFAGPQAGEQDEVNPFRDYRLDVEFRHEASKTRYLVPGFFAADGHAGESGAETGRSWRVHFAPDRQGKWTYKAAFVTGKDVAVEAKGGKATAFDGAAGTFTVAGSDKNPPDFRARGMLRYVDRRYLQFAGSGEHYIKGGADSPENFLGYAGFDGTYKTGAKKARPGEAVSGRLHRYQPHEQDWKDGDPTWKGGKGKGIVGALNYLASKGVNSVYFLTMNVEGDGKDVWPWTAPDARDRYDCSKLDQWEIVFTHMDRLGLLLHVITQETENDQLLERGGQSHLRPLYYRELIARFAHHPALVWNLGEENTNTREERRRFAECIHTNDPYRHPIVIHTFPGKYQEVYGPLLGFEHLHGPSLQMGNMKQTHAETLKWVEKSAAANHPWFVCLDEIGPANTGVKPDKDDPDHDEVRHHALWGNLMAGGAGCEWYFGYKFAHNDLNLEDFRSRDRMWDQTRHALEFFQRHLPFARMQPADELTPATDDYCLAQEGEVYAVYVPRADTPPELKLPPGPYAVHWYNPRAGGELTTGAVATVTGGGTAVLGLPPAEKSRDWVVLVRKAKP